MVDNIIFIRNQLINSNSQDDKELIYKLIFEVIQKVPNKRRYYFDLNQINSLDNLNKLWILVRDEDLINLEPEQEQTLTNYEYPSIIETIAHKKERRKVWAIWYSMAI